MIAAIAIAVAITIVSSIPAATLARTGVSIWDKAEHFAAWLVLAFCTTRALPPRLNRPALAIALCVAFGVLDELHQGLTPGREQSFLDVVADALGAVVGAALAARASSRRQLDPAPLPGLGDRSEPL